jgi:hypothetical protein
MHGEATPRININILNDDVIVMEAGETITFEAEIKIYPDENAMDFFKYFQYISWTIDSRIILWKFKILESFYESGIYKAKFYARDNFGDIFEKEITIVITDPPPECETCEDVCEDESEDDSKDGD